MRVTHSIKKFSGIHVLTALGSHVIAGSYAKG